MDRPTAFIQLTLELHLLGNLARLQNDSNMKVLRVLSTGRMVLEQAALYILAEDCLHT